MMTRRNGLLSLLALALTGCGAKRDTKRYELRGEVKALDPATKSATIKHEKIGDWMEAMTMEFKVKPDSEFDKLHVGDQIKATVVVEDLTYYVTGVQLAPKS
jgi:Cu/Ag efflux protein CusF